MAEAKRVGVVLFQLGGPDRLEAIEPFLYRLFSDPDIIDFPFSKLARKPLAKLIAATRAKKVRQHYAAIGGGSPIARLTREQARALEAKLNQVVPARVFVAMRYWHPLTEEAIGALAAWPCDDLVLLPLYPHYSQVTTGSSLNEWERQYRASGLNHARVHVIREFYDHPGYIEALAERIDETLSRFARPEQVTILYSAHGVQESVIAAGDPYRDQLEATVRLVRARGGWPGPHRLCYQSRVGPGRWLKPTLEETLRELEAKGSRAVLVVPISFVTEHVETLHEIAIEARAAARAAGLEQFEMMPALNASDKFIRALADLVLGAVGADAVARRIRTTLSRTSESS